MAGHAGALCDDSALGLGVCLVYASDNAPVEGSKGEAPLQGETEAVATGGVATLRLRISALSYHHRRQAFRLLVTPLDIHPTAAVSLVALSEPVRSVARLPNEVKGEAAKESGAPANAAATSGFARLEQAHATPHLRASAAPAPAAACTSGRYSPDASAADQPPPVAPLAFTCVSTGSSTAEAPPTTGSDGFTFDAVSEIFAELRSLRAQLAQEVAHRHAWEAAIADQGAQLQMLAVQQQQIVEEMRRLSEYSAVEGQQ